jgi:hypothetical protein
MWRTLTLILAALFIGLTAACAGQQENTDRSPLSGPALLFFYTDN